MESLVKPTLERWFTPPFHKSHPAEVAKIGAAIRATPVAGYAGLIHSAHRHDQASKRDRLPKFS